MRLVPGRLYKVNLQKRRPYERKYGIHISALEGWRRKKPEDFIRLMDGDILFFVKRGEYQESRFGFAAHIPYTFIYDGKIIEFHKVYDITLGSIFEEMTECD